MINFIFKTIIISIAIYMVTSILLFNISIRQFDNNNKLIGTIQILQVYNPMDNITEYYKDLFTR